MEELVCLSKSFSIKMKRLNTGAEERIEITLFKVEVNLNMLIKLEDQIRNYKMRGRTWHMFYQAGTILVQNSQGPISKKEENTIVGLRRREWRKK